MPERIAWTPVTEFPCAIDKDVLEKLSTFANFKTGEGARPSLTALTARAKIKQRRVERSLHRLSGPCGKRNCRLKHASPAFIKRARRREDTHRHATTWNICLERLATHWIERPKVVYERDLTVTRDGQLPVTGDGQDARLTVTGDVQPVDLTVTSDVPIPSTDRSPVQLNQLRLFDDSHEIVRHQEQQRPERAATQDVATAGSGWLSGRDRAAFEADVATLPIPGLFASAKMARKFGYHILDENLGLTFDGEVDELISRLQKKGVVTSEAQCRQAMADCYVQRSMRDRTYDRAADRERRKGRR